MTYTIIYIWPGQPEWNTTMVVHSEKEVKRVLEEWTGEHDADISVFDGNESCEIPFKGIDTGEKITVTITEDVK